MQLTDDNYDFMKGLIRDDKKIPELLSLKIIEILKHLENR